MRWRESFLLFSEPEDHELRSELQEGKAGVRREESEFSCLLAKMAAQVRVKVFSWRMDKSPQLREYSRVMSHWCSHDIESCRKSSDQTGYELMKWRCSSTTTKAGVREKWF